MVPGAAALLIALVALMPPEAADAKAAKARLDVRGGARCLSPDDIIRRVSARSPRVRFADDASLLATVALTSQRVGAVTVTLTLGTAEAAGPPRRVTARSCAEAADAVALILAVTLDPTAAPGPAIVDGEPPRAGGDGVGASATPTTDDVRQVGSSPSPTTVAVTPRAPALPIARAPRRPPIELPREVAPTPADRAPVRAAAPAIVAVPVPPAEEATEPNPAHLQVGGSVAGQMILGAAPVVLPGIALSVMIAAERDHGWAPALVLGWTHVWRSGLEQTGGTASFTLDAGTADACPLRWRWSRLTVRPCGSLLVGRIVTKGTNTEQPGTAARPFSTAGLTINAGLGRTVELSARVGLGITLIRDSYAFGDDVFYRASLLTTSASLGVAARWP